MLFLQYIPIKINIYDSISVYNKVQPGGLASFVGVFTMLLSLMEVYRACVGSLYPL